MKPTNRFSIFDPRRPQTQDFSNSDKEDCFLVMMTIDSDQDTWREQCERFYNTFKEN